MSPDYVYYAAMILIALPVAWLGKGHMALIVLATWVIGQFAYLGGLPEPQTQLLIYLVALTVGLRYCRTSTCTFSAILFVPLALVSLSEWAGWMRPTESWWSIYWIALTQVVSLPFTIDFAAAVRAWRERKQEGEGTGMLRVIYE